MFGSEDAHLKGERTVAIRVLQTRCDFHSSHLVFTTSLHDAVVTIWTAQTTLVAFVDGLTGQYAELQQNISTLHNSIETLNLRKKLRKLTFFVAK